MEIIRNGLVTDEQIKEAISEKYDVSLDNIKVTYNVYHQSANYSFVKNEGGKFSTISNNKLDDDELFEIIKIILPSLAEKPRPLGWGWIGRKSEI